MSLSTCPTCGKRQFLKKAHAKAAARQMKGRTGRLHAYRCGQFWHLGHLPDVVRHGEASRDDITTPRQPWRLAPATEEA